VIRRGRRRRRGQRSKFLLEPHNLRLGDRLKFVLQFKVNGRRAAAISGRLRRSLREEVRGGRSESVQAEGTYTRRWRLRVNRMKPDHPGLHDARPLSGAACRRHYCERQESRDRFILPTALGTLN
jgi:hypothetical protein